MIICDSQIVNLMQIANNFKNVIVAISAQQELTPDMEQHITEINSLVYEINSQQSLELKRTE